MRPHRTDWLYRCPGCGFLASTLTPSISAAIPSALDEQHRAAALGTLRQSNFQRILDTIAPLMPESRRLLDVGCAHGWFLEAAQLRGYTVTGIEPDSEIGAMAQQKGFDVRVGFFPDELRPDETFDVISFNDVLEHIPNVAGAVADVAQHLASGGLLVVNIPVSSGIFYRTANLLQRVGIHGPFDRMWQRHFPSPHMSYFQPAQLQQLVEQFGLHSVYQGSLPSLETAGLWSRLRYDKKSSLVGATVVYAGVRIMQPLVPLLPADIHLHVFRKL